MTYEITLKNAAVPGLPPPLAFRDHPAQSASAVRPAARDLADRSKGRQAADDLVLSESERILADYVRLLSRDDAASDLGTREPD
jgi:hypothetical protein